MPRRCYRALVLVLVLAMLLSVSIASIHANHTPNPTAVTIAGSLQSELGAPGDWNPAAAATHLAYDTNDQVWQATFSVPAGSYDYKVALNDSWDENYGANAQQNGANIPLSLASSTNVKFYYDHKTHWVTDNVNDIIATVVGSFQSELGNYGDWDPAGLRSWLQDPDGDGIYSFVATLPAGDYACKVAINEGWSENYGAGGVPGGANIDFSAQAGLPLEFRYDPVTHILTIEDRIDLLPVTIVGSLQSELGAAGDWNPAAEETHLTFDPHARIWKRTFSLPTGSYEYKVAINNSWDENYGANAQPGGSNIALNLAAPASVTFFYDHQTHWVTDSVNSIIAVVAGSFQSELGNAGDWDPAGYCSWLQDPDGDGIYHLTATLPAGSYACKVAIAGSWDENYGADGVQNGANIPFTALDGVPVIFRYDAASHVLTIANEENPAVVGWCNTQWPSAMSVEAGAMSGLFYGQVYVEGKTSLPGPAPGMIARFGYGPVGTAPADGGWTWTEAAFSSNAGNNDEYRAHVIVALPGTYDYCFRYEYWGKPAVYGDLNGPLPVSGLPVNPGKLTVTPPAWSVTKTASPATQQIMAGQTATIEWTITVTKNDPEAPMATLDDDRSPMLPMQLTESVTFMYAQNYTASTLPSDYGPDHRYTHTMDNTAVLSWNGLQAQDTASAEVVCILAPEISVVKVTVDGATAGDGMSILVGEPIKWRYWVQNPGIVPLQNISLADDKLAVPPAYVSGENGNGILASGGSETWVFEASGTASKGLQENLATAGGQWMDGSGEVLGSATDTDGSSYYGADPKIALSKTTADGFGHQGDSIGVLPGQGVTWIYLVTNTGNVPLDHVGVTDSAAGVTPVYQSGDGNGNGKLDTSETWRYEAAGMASRGWHLNTGTASGSFTDSAGHSRTSTATDNSAYYGLSAGLVTNAGLREFGDLFNLIFTPDIRNWPGHYKLTSSNPGQFAYSLSLLSTGSTLAVELPYPFITTGATPIHVYTGVNVQDNGSGGIILIPRLDEAVAVPQQQVTLDSYGSARTVTLNLTGLPASGFIFVTLHLDDGLEGTNGWTRGGNDSALSDPAFSLPYPKLLQQAAYNFRAPALAGSLDTIRNQNIFKNLKGFGGIVLDSQGDGLANRHIQLWGPDGTLIETMTTDTNGWYWSRYVHKGKEGVYRLFYVEGSEWRNGIVIGGAVKFGEWNIVD